MKWILIAVSTVLFSGVQDDPEAQKKRLAEVMREGNELMRQAKANPKLENDKTWVEKMMALEAEAKKLAAVLTGGDRAKEEALFEEVLKKHAPELHAEMAAARLKSNERNASATLKTLTTAEADFRSNDRDGNLINDFWVGDVAGLCYLVGLVSDPKSDIARQLPPKESLDRDHAIRLIEESVANADAAPLKLEMLWKQQPEKPAPKAGYLFVALKKYMEDGAAKDYGSDTDGASTVFGAVHSHDRFGFVAYPADYGKTGKLTFMVNENNTLWKKDTGGKVPEACPEDFAKAGWSKLD